jgi:hypothetical protein
MDAYELDEDMETAINTHREESSKKYPRQTTIAELDDGSTSSDIHPAAINRSDEDLVIQRPDDDRNRLRSMSRQANRSGRHSGDDLEAAPSHLEVQVEQRYETGSSTRLDSSGGDRTRAWSPGWPSNGYGNRTTIAAESPMGDER